MKKYIFILTSFLMLNTLHADISYFYSGLSNNGMANYGFGYKFDQNIEKIDVCADYSFDNFAKLLHLGFSKEFYLCRNFYIGPSYDATYSDVKYFRRGRQYALGAFIGMDFDDFFIDVRYRNTVYWRRYRFEKDQFFIRCGVKF